MAYKLNDKVENKILLHYVPHGINSEVFKPYDKEDPKFVEFKKKVYSPDKNYKFSILYNSRNIQRKRTSNVMLAFRAFCDNLTKEEANECALILHTEIMCEAGTNLLALKEAFCPNYNIIFSPNKLSPDDMSLLYNVADVTVNASSSEGFGLSVAESIMCGTPVITTVTGGLQDQIGQTDENGNPVKFDIDFGSNNVGKYKKHGKWAYPVWPATRMVQGSIPTPYIFDDVAKWEDFADGFMYWYLMGQEKRKECGMAGRQWALGEGGLNARNMGDQVIKAMDFVFDHWVPPKKFGLFTVKDHTGNFMPDNKHLGFEIPNIDKEKIKEEINKI